MFKSKEEKQRQAELEAQRLKQEKIEEEEKRAAKNNKRIGDFMNSLKAEITNPIICITTTYTDEKQLALNFLLANDYICVQNDFSCDKYYNNHALTFVKENLKDRFSSK